MKQMYTHQPQSVSVKTAQNGANFWRFATVIVLACIFTGIYFILREPIDSLGDPSDQFVVKSIPELYTTFESVDPEERDVFQGFRTSFLPAEELIQAQRQRRGICEGNLSGEGLPCDSTKNQEVPGKQKCTSQDYSRGRRKRDEKSTSAEENQYEEENEDESQSESAEDFVLKKESDSLPKYQVDVSEAPGSEVDVEYESKDEDDKSDDIESSVVHPEHVDRGPLDDVVEQMRGQPELEDGEMGSSAQVFKPATTYQQDTLGIHAFWKDQGDRNTIRNTQAQIMKKYMDAEADPCHDFYQYACGNWASLNPIPADKAGYDTFEMLRENLDTVLKDLLDFKPHEFVESSYPGAHLDLEGSNLSQCNIKKHIFNFTFEYLNRVHAKMHFSDDVYMNETTNINKTEIVNRIRRFLDKKSKEVMKPVNTFKTKIHGYLYKMYKKPKLRKRSLNERNLNGNESKKRVRQKNMAAIVGRKLQMYQTKVKNRRASNRTMKPLTLPKPFLKETLDFSNGDAALKARFLFKSCMNYDILAKRGHQPLLDLLDLLGGWPILDPDWGPTDFDWLKLVATLRLYNNDILISEWVGPDIKNSDEFVIQFDQTSLGLPTRDYFLQSSNQIYLTAYKNYLIKIATLLGGDPAHVRKSAEELLRFEIKLAKITSAPEDRRNVSELYRRMPLYKLEELVPEVKWRRYLCIVMNRTVKSNETVVLFALNYVRHLVKLINETDPSTLSNYLLWRFVRHRVNNLDDRFQSAKQQFYHILFGREQAPPRWKNCITQVNSNMGMALGSMFVRKYFDETSKNDTMTMTGEIQKSFKELLHMTDWIDAKTKSLAAHKVDAMMLRIGYPDFILTKSELDERYKEVNIHPDKYFENIMNILEHLTKMEQTRIGQPVNKTLWNTAPAVVNAYYSRNKNQIMFPAGILQPPFYHRHFPRSLNYGGIGVVIGHEITHGFDDKGRLFDCNGNLHRWWSDSAIEAFHRRAQCLIDQYGHYVVPGINMKLDGVNTQGENIADNGGVKQAFRAYLHWLQRNGDEGETLPGLNHTHTQLFFLNFAQVWCGAMRPEAMRNKLKTAVHSPGRFRVIGTLSNSHDFAREFRCKPGSPMNPTHKCSVW